MFKIQLSGTITAFSEDKMRQAVIKMKYESKAQWFSRISRLFTAIGPQAIVTVIVGSRAPIAGASYKQLAHWFDEQTFDEEDMHVQEQEATSVGDVQHTG